MYMLQQTSVPHTFFVSSYAAQKIHEIEKGYSIFQIKIHEPYSDLNGGQTH